MKHFKINIAHLIVIAVMALAQAWGNGVWAQDATPLVRTLTTPQNGKAVKMAIVTVKQFETPAREYALWKTQQGYDVEEVYVEDFNQGGTVQGENLARAIQSHLKDMGPTFVLIMGDDYHVPAFKGTQPYKTDYATDYFYGEYTGDYLPEAYVGRFSADTEEQLRAQMDKTKYMAQLPAAEGEWLNTSVGLHTYSSDIAIMENSHQYTVDYIEKQGATVHDTNLFSGTTVNNWITEGCAMLTYFGHGNVNGFNGTSYSSSDALKLQNKNHYPLVVAVTCLTGTFDNLTCLAENMQRLTDAGSVAYIGATRESWSSSNVKFMMGGEKDGKKYLGFVASLFPNLPVAPNNQNARTLGEALALGSYAVNSYQSSYVAYNAEYYELFGDPTYQPYIKAPLTMSVTAPASAVAGHVIEVSAAPYAVVCVSAGREIVAVGLADSNGHVAMKLAPNASAGTHTLYCSAPGYTDWKGTIVLAFNDGTQDEDPAAEKPEVKPVLTSSDVINHETAQTVINQWKQVTVNGTSGAVYDTWVSSDLKDCVHMRNNYDYCGIVTTQSGGYVRKVSIDWLYKQGLQDKISVFGSNTPYSVASDVWDNNKNGTLIGTIEKGVNDVLVIPDNFRYVALRAENLDCFISSITIGWGGETFEVEESEGELPSSAFNFNDFTRHKVLIEKFTGQNCQYCAPADAKVETYLTDKNYKDKVVELRHYSYSGDGVNGKYLKIPGFHDTLASTWEISGHPNYMVDRSNNDSYGYMNNGYQIGAEAMANGDYVGYRLRQPCFVSLSLDGSTYDADTRTLKVVVSGKAAKDLPDLRVNVFVTQSGIEAPQSGQGNNYIHDGVTRAFLTTDPNGDELDMRKDSVFQMTYTYTIPESYYNFAADINNMAVVAFVNSWDNYGYNHATEGQKCFENSMVYNTLDVNIASLPLKAQAPALPGGDTPVVPPTEPKEITFADGTAYNATTAVHYDKVTYTRDFKNTEWQALYVPFAIDCDEWSTDYEIARIYNFIDYDDNNDGVFDRTYLVIQKKTSGSTEPNTPYLIRAKETGLHSLVLTDRKLERAQQSSIDCGSVDYDYTFYGTYTGVSDMYAKGYYALSGGALNKANSASVNLGAQRWYMQVTPRTGSYSTKAQSIQILVDGEYATEDIEALTTSPKNESPVTYDLMGRNVKGSVKGISIVNSKKIIK